MTSDFRFLCDRHPPQKTSSSEGTGIASEALSPFQKVFF
jgi:hypothetical protein